MSTLADRAKGTAFEILYTRSKPEPVDPIKERRKALNDKHNAKRAAMSAALRDNKQYTRWTI